MKRLLILVAAALLAACSSPKYTYNFDHYNYQAGKKTSSTAGVAVVAGPEKIQPELLTASVDDKLVSIETNASVVDTKTVVLKKTFAELTRAEKKDVRKEIKKVIKAEKKSIKTTQTTQGMDHDLKLAAIFGAVGVVGLILGGASSVFWAIGGIALLIGVVFFVIWLTKQ